MAAANIRKRVVAGLASGMFALVAAVSLAEVAHQKFARLERLDSPPGTRIDLSAAELNAWARDEAAIFAPGATRNIRLDLTEGGATGSMLVDFLKLRQAATGQQPGWLMKNLFAGERPITVRVRFDSRNRRARVDVDRVEVSGVPVEGATLDFLVQTWLRPTFPDVKINQWFDLGYRVDRFTVQPAGASIFIGK